MMAVEIAWLRSRFDDVSKRHPGFSLVYVLRDENLETGLKKSVYRKKEPTRPFPKMMGANEKYECLDYFPSWNFWDTPSSPWDKRIWAMWLHRDSYFQRSDNLACLNEYAILLGIIRSFADDLCVRKSFHTWTSNISPHVECDDGSSFCGSANWLLLLSTLAGRKGPSTQFQRRSRCPVSPIRMITETYPSGHSCSYVDPAIRSVVFVVPDIGIESILFLDSLNVVPGSNSEQASGLQSLSRNELMSELGKVIDTNKAKHWKPQELRLIILERNPGRTTSVKSIEKNLVYDALLETQGRKRGRKIDPEVLRDVVSQSLREHDAENGVRVRGNRIKSRD